MLSPTVLWKTGGGSTKVTVNSSSAWEAISNREWLVVTPTSGSAGTTEFMMSWENGPSGDATVLVINATKRKEISVHREYNAAADIPTGAIGGKFSVAPGSQVYFSKGNLQYHCTSATWKFAESQNEVRGTDNKNISATYNGWIDLFGWGTSGKNYQPTLTSTNCDNYAEVGSILGTDDDWGTFATISNGGTRGVWRTLSGDEWSFLLSNRTNANNLRGFATVNGVKGLVLLPDNWTKTGFNPSIASYTANVYSSSQWNNNMQKDGAVFLPATGIRKGKTVSDPEEGNYWSSSRDVWIENSFYARQLYFKVDRLNGSATDLNYKGCAVRLVQAAR